MHKPLLTAFLIGLLALTIAAFQTNKTNQTYSQTYSEKLSKLEKHCSEVSSSIPKQLTQEKNDSLIYIIHQLRNELKALDFWLRYLDPLAYKKINGPLPVEWETEAFEKYEKPYRREGAGLTLAELYLTEPGFSGDSVRNLLVSAQHALNYFQRDSVLEVLNKPEHFFFCNRLFLLNLAAIYTTGFECPDKDRIIPELRQMLNAVDLIYNSFEASFEDKKLSSTYHALFTEMRQFINEQPEQSEKFDHFTFVSNYVNPLFTLNQEHIRNYKIKSRSLVDYSLNDQSLSIFSKDLYLAQNTKGIFARISDPLIQEQIRALGKKLFYDPLLSGNNQRSCASCHKPENFFTDTTCQQNLQFDGITRLPRNTATLLNASNQHLLMVDGKHATLQEQAVAVITNSLEMHCQEKDLLKKIMSCKEYKKAFNDLLPYTPAENAITIRHIASALTMYYGSFSYYPADFELQITRQKKNEEAVANGYNLFMSKAQCGTCHFPPQFNGVKPPYVSSEFEVIGVPSSTLFTKVNADEGRYGQNPAPETRHAFRTSGLKNIARTSPYMHNGIFKTLEEVVDFYDAGGGAGRGLQIPNQTLSADSLHLSPKEKKELISFMNALTEVIPPVTAPASLPLSKNKSLNTRKTGGNY
jgi:cytochrome c peroxidase